MLHRIELYTNGAGLSDYSPEEASILAKVLAQSEREYYEHMKSKKEDKSSPHLNEDGTE